MKKVKRSRLFILSVVSVFLLLIPKTIKAEEDLPLWKQLADILNKNYYAPQRFNPQLFLKAYVDFLEKDLPLLQIKKADNLFTWNIGTQKYEIKIDETFDFFAIFQACEKIYESLPAEWWQKSLLSKEKAYYQALSAGLKTLDPHTRVLSPFDTKRYLDRSGNLIYSIGVWVQKNKGYYEVRSVYEDSPAEEANIKTGDILLEINGQSLYELPLVTVQNLLESNLKDVTVEIQKPNGSRETYNIEAEPVQRSSLSYKLINGEIGYIKINRFSRNTHEQFIEAIKELKSGMPSAAYFDKKQGWKFEEISDKNEFGTLQSLIVDLRGNPGGLLEEAIKVCEEFLPKDSSIVLVGAKDAKNQKTHKNEKSGDTQTPIIMLIDENSASAAEIFAGCLQYYNRALVIGRNSFGKGSVQEASILAAPKDSNKENGELVFFRYLVAEYFVGEGQPIQNIGISPNVQIDEIQMEKNQIKLRPTKVFREKDYGTAIKSSDNVPKITQNAFKKFQYIKKNETDSNQNLSMFNFPLEIALQLLAGEEAREGEKWNMKEFYYRKKDLCAILESDQQKVIKENFAKLGLNWKSGGVHSKNLKPAVACPNAKDIIEVNMGVANTISLPLKNVGAIPAYQVRGFVAIEPLCPEPFELYWGYIESSASETATTVLHMPKGIPFGDFEGVLSIFDENHLLLETKITLRVLKKNLPSLFFHVEQESEGHLNVKFKDFSSQKSVFNTFKIQNKDEGEQAAYPKMIQNVVCKDE